MRKVPLFMIGRHLYICTTLSHPVFDKLHGIAKGKGVLNFIKETSKFKKWPTSKLSFKSMVF